MLSTWLLRSGLVLAALVIWFSNLDYRKLIKPDEGRYAEISREMAVSGDWVTPRLNGIKYFEKPPLLYWLNAASFSIFGQNEFAARFAGATCGLLTIVLVWFLGKKLFDRRTGIWAALVLGTSLGFVAQARINLTDMPLTLFLSAALGFFLVASREGERRKVRGGQRGRHREAGQYLTRGEHRLQAFAGGEHVCGLAEAHGVPEQLSQRAAWLRERRLVAGARQPKPLDPGHLSLQIRDRRDKGRPG